MWPPGGNGLQPRLVAGPLGRAVGHAGNSGVGAVAGQKAHRVDVEGVGGAPERGGPGEVHAHAARVVGGVPDVRRRPPIRVGAGLEQGLEHLQIRGALLAAGRGLRIPGAQRPLVVERCKERRHAVLVGQIRIRAARKQRERQVVLPVDEGHGHRGRAIPRRRHVHVETRVHERHGRRHEAIARGVVEGGEAALPSNLIDVRGRTRAAAAAPSLVRVSGAAAAHRACPRHLRLAGAAGARWRRIGIEARIHGASRGRRDDAVAGLPRLRVGRRALFVVDDGGRGREIGTASGEQAQDVTPVLRYREDERRPSVGRVHGVDRRAAIE